VFGLENLGCLSFIFNRGDRVDIDSARKAIEIMYMVAERDVYPRFFSKVEVVKVLHGVLHVWV
jgi:hypothetical protein